ncbi:MULTISPECIES: FimB/Mfa2 family fimbrial subunit [Culturomica]|jgi:hypothetical protein|uniref:FimB/Mfa2 family fimbrial subunit n=1 Tax=Culturomica TaxID=1926651 RepID=UPI0008398D8B|nr:MULTISPECIES: FimB/Mfa2 family fimbrial subunit [Odoribacteraceae]RHV98360.1 hypothetical protein DXA95_01380 [Odoribacter sp. OF09-27XD]HBO25673.1 hypothetical protein [Culturomica sp.]
MRRFYGVIFILGVVLLAACNDDNSDQSGKPGEGPGRIELSVTGRVGTVTGEKLINYVKSLDLFLFRENTNGIYLLTETASLDKEQLDALTNSTTGSNAGFTEPKDVDFDNLPIGNYMIVGLGNMLDSTGMELENANLTGAVIGNTMDQVIASVVSGNTAPRLFFGQTERIVLGSAMPVTPQLTLFRKVAMFYLTLENVPSAVKRIDVGIQNTYGAFDMTGDFLSNRIISVVSSNEYMFTEDQPQLPIGVIALPTVAGQQSAFTLTFYLDNGQVIDIPLQNEYTLKSNTITKLTATIDANQSGGVWKVDLTLSISADVEWNVDQEPGIII